MLKRPSISPLPTHTLLEYPIYPILFVFFLCFFFQFVQIFFRLAFLFKTLRYNNILHLACTIYNNRKHSALKTSEGTYSPYTAHFSSHVNCLLVRHHLKEQRQKQEKLRTIFSLRPSLQFKIGAKVLLRRRKHQFHKTDTVFHPYFDQKIRTVTAIDKSTLPWTYSISTDENDSESLKNRKFYYFELKRIGPYYEALEKDKRNGRTNSEKITVDNFSVENTSEGTFLRSGKAFRSKPTVFYTITRAGQVEKVSKATLQLYQKIFGRDIFLYNDIFYKKENQHLIV